MTEIEYVSWLRAEVVEHRARRFAHAFGRREQRRRFEIALQRDASRGETARFARIAVPIESDRVAPAPHHRAEPGIAVAGEENARHALHFAEDLPAIGEREGLVVRLHERSAPG